MKTIFKSPYQSMNSSQNNFFSRFQSINYDFPISQVSQSSSQLIPLLNIPNTTKGSPLKIHSSFRLTKKSKSNDKATLINPNKSFDYLPRQLKVSIRSLKNDQRLQEYKQIHHKAKYQSRNMAYLSEKPQSIKIKVHYMNNVLDCVYPFVMINKLKMNTYLNKENKDRIEHLFNHFKHNNQRNNIFPTELYKRSCSLKSIYSPRSNNEMISKIMKDRKIILNNKVFSKKVKRHNYL